MVYVVYLLETMTELEMKPVLPYEIRNRPVNGLAGGWKEILDRRLKQLLILKMNISHLIVFKSTKTDWPLVASCLHTFIVGDQIVVHTAMVLLIIIISLHIRR